MRTLRESHYMRTIWSLSQLQPKGITLSNFFYTREANILYWDKFMKCNLLQDINLKLHGLKDNIWEEDYAKTIRVKYMVINVIAIYVII
ncbi:hypothetical protein CR513_55662, partial [Mucuna pruriens]